MKAVRIIMAFLIVIGVLGIIYYLTGREYFAGDLYHYKGDSNISIEQLGLLASEHSTGYQGDITVHRLENSVEVRIVYDFYTSNVYDFLPVLPFSYLDTPIINDLYPKPILYAVGLGGIALLCFIAMNRMNTSTKNKVSYALLNGTWHLVHPRSLIKQPKSVGVYIPNLVESANIEYEKAGILAYRTWKRKGNYLFSAGRGQTCWQSRILLSDKPPSDNNENGVYAVRLGAPDQISDDYFDSRIIGLVSLTGVWHEHADGVVRAESCEILHLFMSHLEKNIAPALSSLYGVPITIKDKPINSYSEWIFSANGMKCLQHNYQIIKGGKNGN